jgi:L-ornithine N5-oxygenase
MDLRPSSDPPDPVVDLLGVGFGPANLALAVAVLEHHESASAPPLTARFAERKPAFGWHRGMLIEGASMQVSFLKDLVTLRNPSSRFSFLSYLHAKDRLIDFINHKCLFPSRIEFHDYLSWCAAQVDQLVDYGREVVSVRPVTRDQVVTHFDVVIRDVQAGTLTATAARNVVVAPGLSPRMPPGLNVARRIWHSSTLLDHVVTLPAAVPHRFVVLGAGQSAAEVADYLHRTYPNAEVAAVFARIGYSQADDSPFANRIFDPATVDDYYDAPDEVKSALMRYHANTNYSAVDLNLIEDLYRRAYQERVQGTERLRMLNMSQVAGVREHADGVEVIVRHLSSGEVTKLDADALVCATGYEPIDPRSILPEVSELLWTDGDGRLRVDRDYRVATGPEVLGGIYLCGATEHSHGITSSLLSMAAVRAGQIVRSIADRTGDPARAATPTTPELIGGRRK